jgi:hypothetical protein
VAAATTTPSASAAAAAAVQTALVTPTASTPTVNTNTVTFSNGASVRGYCSGMGFAMTYDVAQFISRNVHDLHMGYPEDAVVGMWLAATNFKVQHDARFHDWDWSLCSNDSILIHKHDYGAVDEDGVMRSCFPTAQT